jgi:hypothetical protein
MPGVVASSPSNFIVPATTCYEQAVKIAPDGWNLDAAA